MTTKINGQGQHIIDSYELTDTQVNQLRLNGYPVEEWETIIRQDPEIKVRLDKEARQKRIRQICDNQRKEITSSRLYAEMVDALGREITNEEYDQLKRFPNDKWHEVIKMLKASAADRAKEEAEAKAKAEAEENERQLMLKQQQKLRRQYFNTLLAYMKSKNETTLEAVTSAMVCVGKNMNDVKADIVTIEALKADLPVATQVDVLKNEKDKAYKAYTTAIEKRTDAIKIVTEKWDKIVADKGNESDEAKKLANNADVAKHRTDKALSVLNEYYGMDIGSILEPSDIETTVKRIIAKTDEFLGNG